MGLTEEWRTVPGYEGKYEVSDQGEVRSCARTVKASNRTVQYKGRRLKQNTDSSGYRQVCLCDHTRRKTFLVHRLVLEAFVGPKPEGMEARHYPDPTRSNNRLANLSWTTRSINSKDRIEHGTHNWLVDGKVLGNPEGHSGAHGKADIVMGKAVATQGEDWNFD